VRKERQGHRGEGKETKKKTKTKTHLLSYLSTAGLGWSSSRPNTTGVEMEAQKKRSQMKPEMAVYLLA
jgi:hypothetical protein